MYYIDCPNCVGDSYEKINRSEIRGIPSSVKSVSLSACTGAHFFSLVLEFYCFLSSVSIILRHSCSDTHRRKRKRGVVELVEQFALRLKISKFW